uniref:Uncharacterized protein n=1 Tax=Glycine max TaxID=3847 RepID=A0A0R0H4E3_SOYBN
MGCGKSKHDVASGNTVLQRKKSGVSSQENGTETKDTNNNNVVDNVSSEVQVEQKGSESVKESDVEVKDDLVVNDVKSEAEKTNVQEKEKLEGGEERSESEKSEDEKDDSLKENEQKINDAETVEATEEKMPAENEKEDASVKKEEDIKDTKTSISEGEEKDLKAEEVWTTENPTTSEDVKGKRRLRTIGVNTEINLVTFM